MLLLLSACLIIDDELHATRVAELGGGPSDTGVPTVPSDPPAIDTVTPPYGTNAGGTLVTLTGGPFGADPQVRFGGEAGIVRSAEPTTLVVETPAFPNDGYVDLVVTTDGGETTKAGAFTYWKDATGQVAVNGELIWYFLAGDYWSDTDEEYGRATLRFTEGFDYQYYRNWAEDLDTCTHWYHEVPEWNYTPEFVTIDALDGVATETSASSTIELAWNAAEERFTDYDLLPEQVTPGETYSLRLSGTVGLPEVELADVFPVPAHFELTNPAIESPTQPDVTVDQHFEWTTEEEGDVIVLQVGLINAAGDAFEEELHCAVADVGSFWMTADQWTSWAPNRQVHIIIGRYHSGNGLLPWNQGRIATASGIFYYGVGRSR